MDITKYMVDEASIQALSEYQIAKFFESNKPIVQENCHEALGIAVGEPVRPTRAQGMTSYTVIAGASGKKVFQFCAPSAALDMKIMALAKDTYGKFVPTCEERGNMGHLLVYEMSRVWGVPLSIAQREICSINNLQLLNKTVQDLAKFFAMSWTKPTNNTPWMDTATTYTTLSQQLQALAKTLPRHLHTKLNEALDWLPVLFTPTYPQVLNHADLWEMNIHVDSRTGNIDGIVDWRYAYIGPFGLSLWGLETLIGALGSDGWHFHAHHLELRELFWDTLYAAANISTPFEKKAVNTGRVVGIFLAYGLIKGVPVKAGDLSLLILEKVLSLD
ncbi:hypothetical protein N7456_002558 [Penicillium angulare]|uniref:Aminoglycoside phosphotransferase domain-containing protein n=1 Tax=Penicillium angulare TaxID=116970 RepID=A0A9W9G8B6_9EURO|nr:hypothetical protein N7456_002558 [Penicillium angulare]